MSIQNIRIALETQLGGAFPTAWENAPYEPQIGNAFQRVALLPAETQNPTFAGAVGQELALESGVFQIMVYYPKGQGTYNAAARADAIRALFPRGLSLFSGSVKVTIGRTASIAPALLDPDWYIIPISVPYFAYVMS